MKKLLTQRTTLLVLKLGVPIAVGASILAFTVVYDGSEPACGGATEGSVKGKCEAATSPRCVGADKTSETIRATKRAVLCLDNLRRRQHGLRNITWNADLSSVADGHARDMVTRHYFAHLSPGHRDHMDRIAASGYEPSVGCWTAGENLFSSQGSETPRQLVRAWMLSAAHRQNILRTGWNDFGLGVVRTSPDGDRGGMTVVALFGKRSGRAC